MSDPYSLYEYLQENIGNLFLRTKKDYSYWNIEEGSIIQVLDIQIHRYECEHCGILTTVYQNRLVELEWSLYRENEKREFLKVFEKI